ncbi:hypothetical protein [Pectobacterium phage Wc4-1]|uniref:Uncharacterized protein n=1 Tax=Pectobacterium phage Wc4 TaxID=2652428 RepID=A0A5P8D494_9CAUD|nr:hypothetical protein [Pectobacterium phage Wc4]QFP93949.1 hypothetical protein [Pectobacterium phage Wc4-1]
MKSLILLILALIYCIAGVVMHLVGIVFFIKFLCDIFANDLPFWTALVTNIIQALAVIATAVIAALSSDYLGGAIKDL